MGEAVNYSAKAFAALPVDCDRIKALALADACWIERMPSVLYY